MLAFPVTPREQLRFSGHVQRRCVTRFQTQIRVQSAHCFERRTWLRIPLTPRSHSPSIRFCFNKLLILHPHAKIYTLSSHPLVLHRWLAVGEAEGDGVRGGQQMVYSVSSFLPFPSCLSDPMADVLGFDLLNPISRSHSPHRRYDARRPPHHITRC